MADLHSRNDSGAPAGEKKRSLKLEYVDQLRTEIDTLQQDLAEARKLSDSHAKIVEENRLLRLALEQEKFRRLSCEKQADWMRQQISEMSAEMRVVVEHVAAEWKASLFAAAHPASSHNSASQDRHEYTEQTGRRSLITWSADEAESSANFSSSPSSPLTKEMAMRIFARETEHRMHTLDQLSKARKHAGEAWLLPGGGEPDTMNSRVANIDMKEAAGQIKMDAGLLETKSHRAHQDDQMSRNSESCSELSSEEDEEPSSPWRNPTVCNHIFLK
jgi:regulator of replication initiation timing